MKTFKFSLVLHTRENTDVFITLDENVYGVHSKRVNILYLLYEELHWYSIKQNLQYHATFQGSEQFTHPGNLVVPSLSQVPCPST